MTGNTNSKGCGLENNYSLTKSHTITTRSESTVTQSIQSDPVEHSGYYLITDIASGNSVGTSSNRYGFVQIVGMSTSMGIYGIVNPMTSSYRIQYIHKGNRATSDFSYSNTLGILSQTLLLLKLA